MPRFTTTPVENQPIWIHAKEEGNGDVGIYANDIPLFWLVAASGKLRRSTGYATQLRAMGFQCDDHGKIAVAN